MDNIQKSVVFVLLTAGSLVFLLDVIDMPTGQNSTSISASPEEADTRPKLPPSDVIKTSNETNEEGEETEDDDEEEDDQEFGEPTFDADPIDDLGSKSDTERDRQEENSAPVGELDNVNLSSSPGDASSKGPLIQAPPPQIVAISEGA